MKDHPGDDNTHAPPDPARTMEVVQETWDSKLFRQWQQLRAVRELTEDFRRSVERIHRGGFQLDPANVLPYIQGIETELSVMEREAKEDYDAF